MDENATDHDELDTVTAPGSKAEPSEIDKYIRSLRSEAKRNRIAKDEALARVSAVEADWKAKAEAQVTEVRKAGEQRYIRAELKAEAIKAGIVDLDGLRLVDWSEVSLAEDGSVVGADALIGKLKEEKAYLFTKAQTSTSSMSPAPKPESSKTKLATEMTPAEYKAAKAKLLRG